MENKKVVFKVYNNDKAEQEIKEVYFRVIDYCGNPALAACGKDGVTLNRGLILEIMPTGEIKRFVNMAKDIGLVTDGHGRPVISD